MSLLLLRLIARLPLGWVHALGGWLGLAVYALSPTYRRRLRANLARAGFDVDALCLACAREAGKQAVETAWVWLRPAADLRAVMQVVDGAVEREAIASGRPVIYLTPHLGCFEITAQYCVLNAWQPPRSLTALYRIPRKEILRPLVELGRTRNGVELAPASLGGVRQLLRALKRGNAVGILPDQVPSAGDGVWVPFFGRAAYTMTLPGKLAHAANAIVLFIFGERVRAGSGTGAGFRIHFHALSAPLSGEAERDARQINLDLEHVIRTCPTQYLWGYNRYKRPAGVPPPPEKDQAGR
ncbi:MAG TPA: lysophospholipid acyltransferase family protein [Burkholderiaceae bacterium]|nr:lysophospholipid acyltransferase family protein [Burkholderiaceae bacterium]